MLSWRWVKGEPKLKRLPTVSSAPLRIPQPDGNPVPIPLRPIDHPEKKLGVWTTACGDFGYHVEQIKKKGIKWATKMKSGSCPPRGVWLGLKHQLYPQLSYGYVTLTHPPSEVDEVFQSIWYHCLPSLRVNRCIRREWRILPLRFQGLALPNPNIDILCSKIHTIHNHWSGDSVVGKFLRHAYKAFQVEVGIGGNIFSLPYDHYGELATHSFFKHFWQLCDRYQVTFRIHQRYDMPYLRSGDSTLMDRFSKSLIYTLKELHRLNRVRKFKKVHCVGDILLCDGCHINPSMLTRDPGSSSRDYPIEKPTSSDFTLWNQALHAITSQQLRLYQPLGPFLTDPHGPDNWFANPDHSQLYQLTSPVSHKVFLRESVGTTTRFGPKYIHSSTREGACDKSIRASITPVVLFSSVSASQVRFHSSAPVHTQLEAPMTIRDRLISWGNRSLWKTFECDDDGEWIYRGLYLNSLVIVHDGSYMPKVATDVCSAAVAIYCKLTKKSASVTWVEKTTSKTADNYRAELLGGIAAQLIIKAALCNRRVHQSSRTRVGCNNKGVVTHGNKASRPLYERQAQADVLRLFKQLITQSSSKITMYHIYAHLDEILGNIDLLTIDEKINLKADGLAEESLLNGVLTQDFISGFFPFEDIRLVIGGELITHNPRRAISNHWGGMEARKLFHDRGMIHKVDFHLVYWDGVEQVMGSYPEMFQTWVTKHVSHFCGTNCQLSRIKDSGVLNVCPSCGCENESTSHITKCLESGRTSMFAESVRELGDWLRTQRTGRELTQLITSYLLARGCKTLYSLLPPNSPFTLLARFHDRLGWDNFLEGRICSLWVELRHHEIESDNLRTSAEFWARGLIRHLVQITHRQWVYRNSAVHLRVRGSLSQTQHDHLMDTIEDYIHVDPMTLLPEDRAFLEVDFDGLAESAPVDQETWVSEMETAVSAAAHVRAGSRQAIHSRFCSGPNPRSTVIDESVVVDSEGSIRWRRRRRN